MGKFAVEAFEALRVATAGIRFGEVKNFVWKHKLPIFGTAIGTVSPFLFEKDKSFGQKVKTSLAQTALGFAQLGFKNQVVGGLVINAFTQIPKMPGMFRGLATNYRSGLDARTSAAIPFSHSTIPQDLALSAMAYSQSAMNESLGRGTEFTFAAQNMASFMSGRYLSK